MTEDGATHLDTLQQITFPKKLCSTVTYTTQGLSFNKVCRQAVGYQKGSTNVFHNYPFGRDSINSYYVKGVSITYGNPRKHIWSYVAGFSDDGNYSTYNCSCTNVNLGLMEF